MPPTALALYSGGLDSMMAVRLVMDQGIRVLAVRFVTPFFGYHLLAREEEYKRSVARKYGIEVILRDLSVPYLAMLGDPPHGYGRNFNPCVDCKILLLAEARRMLAEFGASFIITGEVVGQRPMSQRLDAMRVIERDSGCEGLLVRPLSALNLKISRPEEEGLIDRARLLGIRGRGREAQMEMAARYGITDYPSPAGGCLLTEQVQGARLRAFYGERPAVTVSDVLHQLRGRQFRLPGGGYLSVGRNQADNESITALIDADDFVLRPLDRPGPLALLRYSGPGDEELAAGIVARYCKKGRSLPEFVEVQVRGEGGGAHTLRVPPLAEDVYKAWAR